MDGEGENRMVDKKLEEAFMGGEMLLMGAVSVKQLHVQVFYCPVG